jgi:hypothetical protein
MRSFQEYATTRDLQGAIHEAARLMESMRIDPDAFIAREMYLIEAEINPADATAGPVPGDPPPPPQHTGPRFWGKIGSWFRSRMGTDLDGRYKYAVKALQSLVGMLNDNPQAKQVIEKILGDLQDHQQTILTKPQPEEPKPVMPAAAPAESQPVAPAV